MAETLTLKSAHDGFEFSAYHEAPFTPRRGGVIVLQEIFGIDAAIRHDVELWAKAGYEAIAPSLFDRQAYGFQATHADYTPGIAAARATTREQWTSDIAACRDFLKQRGKVCIVGYCYGGSLAWMSASFVEGLAAASSYYGSMVPSMADQTPKCPTILHFGRHDHGIPMEGVEAVAAKHPEVAVHIYEAGHGFNSDRRTDYHPDSASLARERTLALFAENGG